MSKYWLAAVAVPVVSLSLVASGALAAVAEDPENVIAAYGTVQNTDGRMGVLGVSGTDTYMFNYTELLPGESVAAADVDCSTAWDAQNILCDPEPTTNVSGALTQASSNTGYTSNLNGQDGTSYIVIDLGAERSFNTLEVFQMRQSDGSVTSAELFVSDELGDTWPVQSDASWTSVAGGPIAEGVDQTGPNPVTNTAVTPFSFGMNSARYVMFYFQNDGSYEQDAWIEVAGVKLFGITTPAAVVPDPALADTGIDALPATLLGMLALLAGAALVVAASRGRAARR